VAFFRDRRRRTSGRHRYETERRKARSFARASTHASTANTHVECRLRPRVPVYSRSSHFVPFLLQAGRVGPGQRILDVATGTGLAAEAALGIVGAGGHVTATDISEQMTQRARERLSGATNVSIRVEDGQALGLPDDSFDAVLCSLGRCFFPILHVASPSSAAHIVRAGMQLCPSTQCQSDPTIIARHVPSQAAAADRLFSLGEARLRALFATAGLQNVEMTTKSHRFGVPSFDEYSDHVERGWGSSGLLYVALPEDTKRKVRDDVRRHVGDHGGPLEIEVEFRFASGQK
jgi:SAM-dependent methyltransferase